MLLGVGLYVTGSFEAAKLYCDAFGMELRYPVLLKDGSGYYHSELYKDGKEVCNVIEAEHTAGPNPVQLYFVFQTRQELERAYELLRQGGETEMEPQPLPWSPWAANVRDRFGVRWYLTLPQHYPGPDFVPER